MSRGRLLLDEMLSPVIARQLRDRGHDVAGIAERAHLTGASDEQVLEVAAAESRTLVTLNIADFVALDAAWKADGRAHGGILYVATSTFPQDRGFIGALVIALDGAAAGGALPGLDGTGHLRRAPG